MRLHDTPSSMLGQPNPEVSHEESPGLSLVGLRDLLEALSTEIQELPPPYPLFAVELEEGLAESFRFEAQNKKTTDAIAWRHGVGGSTEHTLDKGVNSC